MDNTVSLGIKKEKNMSKFFKISLFAAVLLLVFYAYVSHGSYKQLPDLAFSNIEALAGGETGSDLCLDSGSVYCNGYYYRIKLGPYNLD